MSKIIGAVALLCCCQWLFATGSPAAVVEINFYSEQVKLGYNPEMLTASCGGVDEKNIVGFYRQLERKDYKTFLDDLYRKKQELQLNDWLFYELMRQSIDALFQHNRKLEQELTCWFLLSQASFDTRLTYLGQRVYVYVHTTDEIFEIPMIEDKGKTYVRLTNQSLSEGNSQEALYLLNFVASPSGKAFSFYLKTLPKLKPEVRKKMVRFKYNGSPIQIEVQYNKTMVDVMKNYPLIAEREYLELPLSEILSQSLLPQFQELLKDKTTRQALELLLAFTRSSFEYKEDKAFFGKSKPMIADEVFFYPYSDCEDRTALFYAMVKELLDLPMIVIAFPDHLTVAVGLTEELPGAVVTHNGKRYYICDPTGPVNSSEIGIFPRSYEDSVFEIISDHK